MTTPRISPRYPQLSVYPDGRIYDLIEEKFLVQFWDHDFYFSGPAAIWKENGRQKNLDVVQMVYEAHCKNDTLNPKMKVVFRDGQDITPTNLRAAFKGLKNTGSYKRHKEDGHYTWMNGSDEIYF